MTPPSVMVVADLHIDFGSAGARVGRISSAWEVAHRTWLFSVQQAAEHQVQALVLAGDVFDTGHPWPEAIAMFREGLELAQRLKVEVIIVGGNHELSPRPSGHRHVLQQFAAHPAVSHVVLHDPEVIHLDGLDLVAVPWPDPARVLSNASMGLDLGSQIQAQKEWLNAGLAVCADQVGGTSLLVGHLMMEASRFTSDVEARAMQLKYPQLPASILAGPWVASILGHVHIPQQFSGTQVHYAGIPWSKSFDDAGRVHGPNLVSLTDDGPGYNMITIPGPDRFMRRIEVTDVAQLEDLEIPEPARAMINVVVTDISLVPAIQAAMAGRCATLKIDAVIPTAEQPTTGSARAMRDVDNPLEAIATWAQSQELSETQIDGMLRAAVEIIEGLQTKQASK